MEKPKGRKMLWIGWSFLTLSLGGFFLFGMIGPMPADEAAWTAQARHLLLPGKSSHGHYQIELACKSCHRNPFGGDEALQEACMDCHGEELKTADDSHPRTKFTDPRNAERVARLDARLCIACHVEHRPLITGIMAMTQPQDICFYCHQDIAEDRPSHTDMGFDTCATAGCHNFHDNRALYEDFLLKHLDQPPLLAQSSLPKRGLRRVLAQLPGYPAERYPLEPLDASAQDVPAGVAFDGETLVEWAETSHAAAGVNCSACHQPGETWIDRPDHRACAVCHADETHGFLSGRHGMRLKQGLSPMRPSLARLPMKPAAHDRQLGCASCHGAHRFDTRKAAVEACLGCHDDAHSRAYEGSPHHRSREAAKEPNSEVSCATCHLPRIAHKRGSLESVLAQHNQNDNLRPNEKMLRQVCMHCHGLGFSIDALAAPELIESNFRGQPAHHVESLEMAAAREAQK